jgi:hypothetical protein
MRSIDIAPQIAIPCSLGEYSNPTLIKNGQYDFVTKTHFLPSALA